MNSIALVLLATSTTFNVTPADVVRSNARVNANAARFVAQPNDYVARSNTRVTPNATRDTAVMITNVARANAAATRGTAKVGSRVIKAQQNDIRKVNVAH